MKVSYIKNGNIFTYTLTRDEDDPTTANRSFVDVSSETLELVNDSWVVGLPEGIESIHPDAHAAAIWVAIRPFIGSRLELPFPVSTRFAEWMTRHAEICITNVDEKVIPRTFPVSPAPCLLFSGGVDSLAATQYLPASTVMLISDRIPHFPEGYREDGDQLIDLVHQRAICRALEEGGRKIYRLTDDHENLCRPYPTWHSAEYLLPALYMCNSLNLGYIETGDVLDVHYFQGYIDTSNTPGAWAFNRERITSRESLSREAVEARAYGRGPEVKSSDPTMNVLEILGMIKVSTTFGLTEVATARVVHDSPYRGKGASCYYRADTNYCMRCDKCFKKLLLDKIFDDEEVPAEFIDSFLQYPEVRDIFQGPYLQWHHIWYYIFQKLRCDHPWINKAREQTMAGPDLAFLEKWYPGAAHHIPPIYRDEVLANLSISPGIMTAEEAATLESLTVPGLEISPWMPPRAPEVEAEDSQEASNPEPEDAQPPQEPDHLAVNLERVLKAAAHYMGGSIKGWTLASVISHLPGSNRRTLSFQQGAESFIIDIEPLAPGTRHFMATRLHGISHASHTPPSTGDHMAVILLVKKSLTQLEDNTES